MQFKTCQEGLQATTKLHRTQFLDSDRFVEVFKSNNFERRAAMIYEARLRQDNPYKLKPDSKNNNFEVQSYGGLNLSTLGSKVINQIETTEKSNEKYRLTYTCVFKTVVKYLFRKTNR